MIMHSGTLNQSCTELKGSLKVSTPNAQSDGLFPHITQHVYTYNTVLHKLRPLVMRNLTSNAYCTKM